MTEFNPIQRLEMLAFYIINTQRNKVLGTTFRSPVTSHQPKHLTLQTTIKIEMLTQIKLCGGKRRLNGDLSLLFFFPICSQNQMLEVEIRGGEGNFLF